MISSFKYYNNIIFIIFGYETKKKRRRGMRGMKFGPLIRRVWRNDKRWRAWIECDVTLNEFITVINEVHFARKKNMRFIVHLGP